MQFDKDIRRMSVKKDRMRILRKYLDFSLFCDPVYLVILISNAACSVSYMSFVILLPAFGVHQGLSMSLSPYLISILSFFDLIGRMGASILSDYRFVPKSAYFVVGLLISGVAITIVPWTKTMPEIGSISALFGLSSGAVIGVTAIVMSDYLGREKLTSTYGISLFVNGILQLFGPPICAAILGDSNNFQLLFVLLGALVIIGTTPWVIMPFVSKRRGRGGAQRTRAEKEPPEEVTDKGKE